jgi:choline monooxygenase
MAALDARTLPSSWYTDPAIHRLEQERIFRRSWQYAGRADQAAEPGSYFPARAGDVPILVTRDRDGVLRAFVNVCRHRGSEVVLEAGRRETVQCHYHAWTYGLDGSLRSAPRTDREPGFDASELSLLPVAVESWGPFLFVNPDPEAPPLADALGRMPALLAEGGLDVDALRFHSRVAFELETNWKVAAENFLECYHCAVAHPSLAQALDVSPDAYVLEAEGLLLSQFARPHARDGRPLAYDPHGEIEQGQFHLLFPNFKLNVVPGRPNLSAGVMLPQGPERTVGFFDYFFGADVPEEWIAEMLAFDDQVGLEDKGLVESVQRGHRSGMVEHGRLLLSSEHLIAHYERLVTAALE